MFFFQNKKIKVLLIVAVLLMAGSGYIYSHSSSFPWLVQHKNSSAVLAAQTQTANIDNLFQVNFPTEFTNTVTFDKNLLFGGSLEVKGKASFDQGIQTDGQDIVTGAGQVIAPNILYGITAGNGISVSSGQTPTITNTGITSFQGTTGDVTLTAGSGISIDGTTISSSQGSDTGSAQNIFKNFTVSGQPTITATNNNDSLDFVAGTGIVLTTNAGDKQVAISAIGGNGTNQWTTSGSNIYYTSGNVGIGTTNPSFPLDVAGTARITNNLILGSTSISSLAGAGLAVTGGVLGVSLPTSGGTSSTTSSFSGLEFTNNQLTLLQGCNDAQLLKWNISTQQWVCSDDAGGNGASVTVQNGASTFNGVNTFNFLLPDFIASNSGSVANISLDYAGSHIAQTNQPETITGNWNFSNGLSGTNLILTNNTNQIVLGTGSTGTISVASLTGNQTYTFPNQSGTVCLTSGNCIGGGGGGLGGSGTLNMIAKFSPDGSHLGNSSIFDNGQVDIGSTSPVGLFTVDGSQPGKALVVLNQTGTSDIFTASASGITQLTLDATGNLNIAGGYNIGGLTVLNNLRDLVNIAGLGTNLTPLAANTYSIGTGTGNQLANVYSNALFQNGNQVCDLSGNCNAAISAVNMWDVNNGTIFAKNTTMDLLLGGISTNSAKFAFINVNSGIPTASISGSLGSVYLTAIGNIATTNGQSLTLGGAGTGNVVVSGIGTGVVQAVNGALSSGAVANNELQNSGITITTGSGLSGGSLVSLGGSLSLTNTGVTSITGTPNQVIASSGTGDIILSLPQSIDTGSLPTFAGATLSSFNGNNAVVYGTAGTGQLASATTNASGLCLESGSSNPTWGSCSAGFTAPAGPFQVVGGTIQEINPPEDFLLGGTSTSSAQFAILNLSENAPVASLSSTTTGKGVTIASDGSIQSLNNGNLTIGGNTTGNIILDPTDNGKVGVGTATPSGLFSVGGNVYGAPSSTGQYLSIANEDFTDANSTTSGTVDTVAFNSIAAPTLSSVSTGVVTNHAATLLVAGAPQTGANERIQNPYAIDVQSGDSAFGGGIDLTGSSNTTIGTAVEGLWPLNGNTYTYKDTMSVSNTDIGTLPIGYEVTVVLAGNQAAQIYNNSRSDEQDFRIGYNGTTEIARNITTFTSSSVIFTFQLQATIGVGITSTAYAIYYDNPLVTAGAPTYNAGFQLDSLDAIAGNWNSSDQVQFPVSQENSTTFEGAGSMKTIATVDNVTAFSTTSQNPLDAAISNFGFLGKNIGGVNYLYTLGGSTDGTAANARATVYRTSIDGTTGNVNAGATSANSLPSPVMDNATVMYTPQVNGGTGADGTLDLSKGGAVGGCDGVGLSWSGSTCTMLTKPTYTYNAAGLGGLVGYGSHTFTIPSGPNSGKILIITGLNTSSTEIYDPSTNTITTGPTLPANAYAGSNSFLIPSGPQAGKILTVMAGGILNTGIYDPSTNTYSDGPMLTAAASNGSNSFQIPSGSNAGKEMVILGHTSTITNIYDPSTNTFSAGPSTGAAVEEGGHSIQILSGSNSGKYLSIMGNRTTTTKIYDPSTNTFGTGPTLTALAAHGSHSIQILSGSNAGGILTIIGGGAVTDIYNPTSNTYFAGPSLTSVTDYGGHSIQLTTGPNAGKILTFIANNSTITDLFDPSTDTYSAGPASSAAGWYGSNSFLIPTGPQAGKFLTILGSSTGLTDIYDPSSNTSIVGPSLGGSEYFGAHSFQIPSGSNAGKILTIAGGTSTTTMLYDPSTNTYSSGPNLTANAYAGSHSFQIPSGSNAGKILTVLGNSTALTDIYDPSTNTFSSGPSLGANAYIGAHSFQITSGSNAGKILTVLGGNTATTKIYDPSTNTYGAGPALGAIANDGSHSFSIPTGPNSGKVLTILGGATQTTEMYDPSTNSFSTGPLLGATADYGSHSFQITSGSNAGKVLTVIGNNTPTTEMYDPSTNTYAVGPFLGVVAYEGSHSFQIPSGSYAGEEMTIIGNQTTGTDIYNPAKNNFNFTTINIPSGITLTSDLPFSDNNGPHIATMSASGNVTIGGTINLVGLGYASAATGFGPGGAGTANLGGCGGSYIAVGGKGGGPSNCTLGKVYTQDDAGSGASRGQNAGTGGNGGGAIAINSAGTITIASTGSIDVDGGTGNINISDTNGGGSGGLIHLSATNIINNGTLSANGGSGGKGNSNNTPGGGGGGGKILLSYSGIVTPGTISTNGGALTSTLNGSVAGSASTYTATANPPTIYSLGGQNTSGTAQSSIYQAGVSLSDGSIGTFSSAANALPQALYGLTANTIAIGNTVYLYAIGGNNGVSDQTTVYTIPVDSSGNVGVGTTIGQAQLTTGISHHATVTGNIGGNNYIWVIGGENGITAQNTIYKGTIDTSGNIATLTTSGQATLPTPLYGEQAFFQTIGNNNYLYILGGTTTGGAKQTGVYKATLDGSGNVTSVSSLGQYQLGTGLSNFGVANFTDNSGNNDAYILGGFTTGTQSTIQKAVINSDQTGYSVARTNFAPTDLSNMNDITFWVNASLAGTYMTMDINTGTSGSPNWQQCNFNSTPNFTIPSTNTWDRIDCNITPISGRTAVTGLRVRVVTSQTQPFTTYFDDFEAKTSASTLTSSALVLAASLGGHNLDLNAQGNGIVALNYDPTNALAGTGGFTVYNGGTTSLMTLTSAGSLGIGNATPAATLDVWGNSGTTPVASFSGQTASAALVVNNNGMGDLFAASSSGTTRFVISQMGNINTTGSASIAGALTFAGTPTIQTTNNQSLTIGGATTGNIILNPLNSTASAAILPGAAGTVDIGSAALPFRNLYITSLIASSSGIVGFVQRNLGAVAPTNTTDDFLVGSAATTSAIVRLPGLINQNAFFALGTGNFGIGTNNPAMATLDVRGTSTTLPGEFIAANTSASGFIVNNAGTGNLFTASTSGTAKFTLANNGNIGVTAGSTLDTLTSGTLSIAGTNTTTLTLGRLTQLINLPGYGSANNSVLFADNSANGALTKASTNTTGQCIVSGATTPTWGQCGSISPFQLVGGTVQEINNTQDLLLGGTSTASAKFAVISINSGTPIASLSAGAAGGLSLSANGTIGTTAEQTLTLGSGTTGNIVLNPSSQAIINGALNVSGVLTAQNIINAQGALNVTGLLSGSNITATGTVSGQMLLQNGNQVCDVSGNCNQGTKWTQSDWSGGSGQANFAVANQYSSGTNINSSTANQVSLSKNEKFVNNNFAVDTSSWTATATISANTVSYYKMDEASGSTVADSAGTNTGTATGTTVVAGKINNGRSFNGSSDTISLGNDASLEFAGDFSIGAWVFENAAGTGEVVQKGTGAFGGGGAGTDYEFGFVGGTLYFQMHGANGVSLANLSTSSVSTSSWHYITAVFKSSTSATIYVDGVQQATTATTVNHTEASTGVAHIGSGPSTYFFNGKIDEVGLWSRALSPFDIATIYNAGAGLQYPFAGTVIRNTTTTYNGTAASAQVTGGGMTQSVTTGDTNKYNLIAFAFTDGSAVTAANTQLIANGVPVTTTYTSVGGGWYELSGIVTGSISAVPYGVTVSTGQTVYFDGMSLSNYTTAGTLTSSIFDTGQTTIQWQSLTYSGSMPANTSLSVKLITSNSSSLAGAPAYSTCTAISNGVAPTSANTNGCVNNNNRYVQYQVAFTTTDTSVTPLLTSISIGYSVAVATFIDNKGATYNTDISSDFLIGGISTGSAAFGVLNVSGGIPIASLSAGVTGGASLSSLGNLATTNAQSLTLGGTTTGNIILTPGNGTGFVGINDSNPTNTLKVAGSLCVSSHLGACSGNTAGTIYADTTTITGADVAENYVSSQDLIPGTVVAMSNDGNSNAVVQANTPNQTTLLGIVSTQPGVTVNSNAQKDPTHPNIYPIALVGRVPVRVSSSNGTIAVGDALTSSSLSGVAMKATQPGMIIGRALEADTDANPDDVSSILVYTNVSWYDPTSIVNVSGNVFASPTPAGVSPLATDSAILLSNLGQQVTTLQLQQTQQSDAIASLSAQLNTLQDTVTLLSTESGVLTQLTTPLSDNMFASATMSGSLTVMGSTLLNKLDVTGNITAGLLTINGLTGTFDVIGQPLQLQSEAVSPIELEDKNVLIATNGDIRTTGSVTAKEITTGKLNILDQNLLGTSVGEATLSANTTTITITTTAVTKNSQIFLTPHVPLDFSLGVTSKVAGTSFTVTSFKKFPKDISFSWWIIN